MNVRSIVIPVILLDFVSGACLVEITILEKNLSAKCFEILALKTDEFRFIFAHAQGWTCPLFLGGGGLLLINNIINFLEYSK